MAPPVLTIRAPPLAKLLPTVPSPTTPPLEQVGPPDLDARELCGRLLHDSEEVMAQAAVGGAQCGVVVRDRARYLDAADRPGGLALPVGTDRADVPEEVAVRLAEWSLVVDCRDELRV